MAASRIIDISIPLDQDTPAYSGDPVFRRDVVANFDGEGKGYCLSTLSLSAHSGTHIDAPAHFLPKGKTIDQIPVRRWLTPAIVLDTGNAGAITADDLEGQGIRTGDAVLLKANARRGPDAAPDDFTSLTLDAAKYLVSRKINLVGIDALSIESYTDPAWPVHKKLLRNSMLIMEGLRLAHVKPGRYTLIATPLLVTGGDGAPARALLVHRG